MESNKLNTYIHEKLSRIWCVRRSSEFRDVYNSCSTEIIFFENAIESKKLSSAKFGKI